MFPFVNRIIVVYNRYRYYKCYKKYIFLWLPYQNQRDRPPEKEEVWFLKCVLFPN